jgi:hypothetical protein
MRTAVRDHAILIGRLVERLASGWVSGISPREESKGSPSEAT